MTAAARGAVKVKPVGFYVQSVDALVQHHGVV